MLPEDNQPWLDIGPSCLQVKTALRESSQPEDLLARAHEAILPPSDPPTPPEDLLAATRAKYDLTGSALILQRWAQDRSADDA